MTSFNHAQSETLPCQAANNSAPLNTRRFNWVDGILCMLVALFVAAYFAKPVETIFAFPENTVWKHRQNNSNLALNSIGAGASGIELDIMLVGGKLRVAHDKGEIQNSQSLDHFLSNLADKNVKPSLWLDMKNMSFINEIQVRGLLLSLIERYKLEDRLLVESPRPLQMTRLCQTIIRCSIWVQKPENIVSRIWSRALVRGFSNVANLLAISIDYSSTENIKKIVPIEFPVLLYTFPSINHITRFADYPRYSVLLTD